PPPSARPGIRLRWRGPTRPSGADSCGLPGRRDRPRRRALGPRCDHTGVATTRIKEPWSALLEEGRGDGRLVREAFEGAREPDLVPIPEGLHPLIYEGLDRLGIDAIFSHQAETLFSALERTTIVTTGTAS